MKRIAGLACAVGLLALTCTGGTINYFNSSADGGIIDFATGAKVLRANQGGTYSVALMQAVGGIDDLRVGSFTDDVMLDQATFANPFQDGIFNKNYTSDGGISIYCTVFNANDVVSQADLGSATAFLHIGGGGYGVGSTALPTSVPSFANPTDTFQFNAGSNSGSNAGEGGLGWGWEPIPEPGSIALFGLGMLTIAMRRRFRK